MNPDHLALGSDNIKPSVLNRKKIQSRQYTKEEIQISEKHKNYFSVSMAVKYQ